MERQRLRWVTIAILATSAVAGSAAAQQADAPPLPEIIFRALARAEAQDESKADLRFESIVETEVRSLDSDGETTKRTTLRSRRYPLAGAVYEELIERDGQPLTASERREEAKKREAFNRKAKEAAASGNVIETNDERQVRFDSDLMSRYRASVVGEAEIGDDTCWVVAFEPREGRLPEESRMDRTMNKSAGRLYITQENSAIARIEFELQRPVSYLWGLIASLRRASGRLDFERVEPNVWLPKQYDISIDLRILFRTTRRHIVRTWHERTRIEPG